MNSAEAVQSARGGVEGVAGGAGQGSYGAAAQAAGEAEGGQAADEARAAGLSWVAELLLELGPSDVPLFTPAGDEAPEPAAAPEIHLFGVEPSNANEKRRWFPPRVMTRRACRRGEQRRRDPDFAGERGGS